MDAVRNSVLRDILGRAAERRAQVILRVARHLCKQRSAAIVDGGCFMVAPDGRRCAVGCLLPSNIHEHLGDEVNDAKVADLLGLGLVEGCEPDDQAMLMELMNIHDNTPWVEHPDRLLDNGDTSLTREMRVWGTRSGEQELYELLTANIRDDRWL